MGAEILKKIDSVLVFKVLDHNVLLSSEYWLWAFGDLNGRRAFMALNNTKKKKKLLGQRSDAFDQNRNVLLILIDQISMISVHSHVTMY